MLHNILKRTFEARSYIKGSEERNKLNKNAVTSEYMPSYKWQLLSWADDGSPIASFSFKTRKEAEESVKRAGVSK